MDWSMPGFPVHHQLPELAQTRVQRVSDAIQPSHPLSSVHLPSIPASGSSAVSQPFTSGGQVLELQPQFFFRIEWLDLLAVQGTLKSLLQQHSWKASIPRGSAFFMVQLSPLYMTSGETIC